MKQLSLASFLLLSVSNLSAQETVEIGIDQKIDQAFAPISDFFFNLIFFNVDIPSLSLLSLLPPPAMEGSRGRKVRIYN